MEAAAIRDLAEASVYDGILGNIATGWLHVGEYWSVLLVCGLFLPGGVFSAQEYLFV